MVFFISDISLQLCNPLKNWPFKKPTKIATLNRHTSKTNLESKLGFSKGSFNTALLLENQILQI